MSSWSDWTSVLLGQHVRWENTQVFLLLALVPTLLLALWFSRTGLSLAQQLLSFLLRGGFFVCLILSMGQPLVEVPSSKKCELVLIDVSKSVSEKDLAWAGQQLSEIAKVQNKGDELRLLVFAESARELPLTRDAQGKLVVPEVPQMRGQLEGEGTDMQLALERGLSYVGSDCHNRFYLFSDGIETRQSALAVVPALLDRGVALETKAFEQSDAKDVAVIDLTVEGEARVGEPFKLRVDLEAAQDARGQLRLYQGEILNGLDSVKTVELPAGTSSHSFDTVVRVGGEVTYRAEYIPEGPDAYAQNNSYVLSIDVPGPVRVLVVDRRPAQITHLVDALVAQQFDVDVRGPEAFPRTSSEIGQFEFVILSDLGREHVSRGGESLIESYVRGGGGLLVSGGEAGFGPGGWQGSNLEKILPVRMDAKKEREIPGVAMSLVIDRSGSMTGLPLSMAKEACVATLGVLSTSDLIEVIAFDSRPTSYVPLQPARYRFRIEEAVARIQPGGGTEIFNSLDLAYQSLSSVEARRKHIILLTDGNASSDGVHELVSTAFADGITITSVGLGGGTNQAFLTMIAEAGGGRFIQADDPARLPRIFTRETEMISAKPTLDDWFPLTVAQQAAFLEGVGLESAPFLRGYTSTQLARAPAEAILLSDRGEPILARRPVGVGWTLAWTSDFKTRWATDFLRFRNFGKFIAQLVREHQKSDETEIRPMSVALRGDQVVARVEAFDDAENFENKLESALEVRRHLGSAPAAAESEQALQRVAFKSIAPGLYEAVVDLPGPGAYSLKAVHQRRGEGGRLGPAGVSFGSISLPYPEEYRDLRSRPEQLGALARLARGADTNGGTAVKSGSATQNGAAKTIGAVANTDRPELSTGERRVLQSEGKQHHFILLAVIFFFLDLLVRRVRIFDRGFKGSRFSLTKRSAG